MTRRLRSTRVRTTLLGATAFTLVACDEPPDLTYFDSVDQCKSAAFAESFEPDACDVAFEQALAEHAVLAPRYESLELCESQHGDGACGVPEVAGGEPDQEQTAGGPSFMPFFMGYMMGSMLSGGMGGSALYRDTQGRQFSTSGQGYNFQGAGSTVKGSPSAIRPLPSNIRQPPVMTRAAVAQRGGFGAARTAAMGRSSAGG